MEMQDFLKSAVSAVTSAAIKLLIALAIMLISFKIINYVAKKIESSAEKRNADKTIMRTAVYVFKLGMKIVVGICLVGYVGIDTGGLTALVTSFGVCVGLAVNGTLSNLAGGVLIILTRPFRIDDYIEAQGYSGTVEDIHITNTRLKTPDNKIVFIPNGALSTGSIVNYSLQSARRVDLSFLVSYSEDFEKVKKLISAIAVSHPLVLKDPAPFVRIGEYTDHAVSITTRLWVASGDFWTVRFDMLESVKEEFDKEGIEIPFNQLDIHVKSSPNEKLPRV